MDNTIKIRVYTLGQLRLERWEETEWLTVTDAVWQHQRVRILLRCLVSLPNRCVDRKLLLDQMWSGLEHENASGRLDRAVHDLRRIVEPERQKPATSPFLLTRRETITLADQHHIWIDADAFEQCIVQAHASNDLTEKEKLLAEAAKLYQGDFLPEEQDRDVILQQRQSLKRSYIHLLADLAEVRLQRNALSDAIEPLEVLLSLDGSNEAAAQQLMRVLKHLKRRGEALRVYKRISTSLQQELHIVPSAETRLLYETIRDDVLGRSEVSLPSSSQETSTPLRLSYTSQHCEQTSPQDYEFIDVQRDNGTRDTIYMTLFDDHAIQFFLLAVIHDAFHFPVGSEFRFQAFHPDAPSRPHLPDMPIGTATFIKQREAIEVVTTTGILTELVTKFGFTNSPDAPSVWVVHQKDIMAAKNGETSKHLHAE